jgi:hypothetical protein
VTSILVPAQGFLQTFWEAIARQIQNKCNHWQASLTGEVEVHAYTRDAFTHLKYELENERNRFAVLNGSREQLYEQLVDVMKENQDLKAMVLSMMGRTEQAKVVRVSQVVRASQPHIQTGTVEGAEDSVDDEEVADSLATGINGACSLSSCPV